MQENFIGRKRELNDLNELYAQHKFHLFILYYMAAGVLEKLHC